jgi:hypothetical protein
MNGGTLISRVPSKRFPTPNVPSGGAGRFLMLFILRFRKTTEYD